MKPHPILHALIGYRLERGVRVAIKGFCDDMKDLLQSLT